ncbi:MAG: UvrD-helicase domain-containing protein [Muribaculaceae bacterium]|nr:UvrD-helicase domain-containing protein [Muribaculaceae bacterium]
MTDALLNALNGPQRAAVEYCDGPELVIAGAGSGKTRVITYKIAYLLDLGLKPWNILALTFTNKAAREMQERISALAGADVASALWMGTFHSVFSRILRRHADRIGYKSNFTIYDASDSKSLVKTIIRQLQLDDKAYSPGKVQTEISNAKNALLSPEAYAADSDIAKGNRYTHTERMPDIYRIYCDRCRVAGAMDFDDLLFNTYTLLKENPDLLEHYRQYFDYVLVDEYQDTNRAQHLIISLLCAPDGRVCVVGDDAQSIYSFRGANIRNILEMNQTFPNLRIFKLEENYRSTRTILNAAGSLIAANKNQIPKEVFSNRAEGDPIELCSYADAKAEAEGVANRLVQIRRRLGVHYSDIAILYRTNAQSRELEEAFRSRNIPYRVYGGLSFYQRKEVKDAIAYFRLCVNPDDDSALERIINEPKRGIGDTTVGKLRDAAIDAGTSIYTVLQDPDRYGVKLNKGTRARTDAFTAMITDFATRCANDTPADVLAEYVMTTTGLMDMYRSDNTPEFISKLENLQELIAGVQSFCDEATSPEDSGMGAFLAEISLLTDTEVVDEDNPESSVTMMTIHAAKGLEFEAVFLVGVEDQFIPSERSLRSPADVEEERRLMYVAITRAKQFCGLSYASFRMHNGQRLNTIPSRFIMDIDMKYLHAVGGTVMRKNSWDSYGSSRRSNYGSYGGSRTNAYGNSGSYGGSSTSSYGNSRRHSGEPEMYCDYEPKKKVHTAPIVPPIPRQVIGGSTHTHAVPKAANGATYTIHASSELSVGMDIEHNTHGRGTITNIDDRAADHRIVVRFTDGNSRTLLLKYAKFIILNS